MENLNEIAERLWPNDEVMQQKWQVAVSKVRQTQRGWILDTFIPKRNEGESRWA